MSRNTEIKMSEVFVWMRLREGHRLKVFGFANGMLGSYFNLRGNWQETGVSCIMRNFINFFFTKYLSSDCKNDEKGEGCNIHERK
jgi:hypothetical protein